MGLVGLVGHPDHQSLLVRQILVRLPLVHVHRQVRILLVLEDQNHLLVLDRNLVRLQVRIHLGLLHQVNVHHQDQQMLLVLDQMELGHRSFRSHHLVLEDHRNHRNLVGHQIVHLEVRNHHLVLEGHRNLVDRRSRRSHHLVLEDHRNHRNLVDRRSRRH